MRWQVYRVYTNDRGHFVEEFVGHVEASSKAAAVAKAKVQWPAAKSYRLVARKQAPRM